ncbi:MAG: DMT family transporter [Chloroflexota bacterium]
MPNRSGLKRIIPYVILFAGVAAAASAAIMIRLAQDLQVPSTTIAAGRLGIAALILLPIALVRAHHELREVQRRDWILGGISGTVLAIHFLAWISSLEYTSVASSVALVATNPLWVAIASVTIFRERLTVAIALGVVLTISGSVLIGISDSQGGGRNALFGNALALGGAITASIYFLIGRDMRRRLSTLAYIWIVYTSAALVLIAVALSVGLNGTTNQAIVTNTTFFGLPFAAYTLLLGLALGPQLLGHTAFNWSLRYLSATFVAVAILGEPIGSAILALFLFSEGFAPLQLAGFLVLLVGIAVALIGEQSRISKTKEASQYAPAIE